MARINYLNKITELLSQLKKTYPNQTIGSHISIALGDYTRIDALSDAEFLNALEKYTTLKELDMAPQRQDNLEKLIEEGTNIETLLQDEWEDDDF